jgi:hypothetical protein
MNCIFLKSDYENCVCETCLKQLAFKRAKKVLYSIRYFARDSITWNGGGVAFLSKERSDQVESHGMLPFLTTNNQMKAECI